MAKKARNASQSNQTNHGAEWHRWDPHIHTKGTAKNDQFKSKSWEDFIEKFFRAALEHDVHAIGVTDYHSLDNYLKVLDYQENLENRAFTRDEVSRIKEIFLFPNVELRMLPTTSKASMINIHCLFDPKIVGTLQNEFFEQLSHASRDGSKKSMSRESLKALGREGSNAKLSDDEALRAGQRDFCTDLASIQQVFKDNPGLRAKTLIVVSNSSNDGASGLQNHTELGTLSGALKVVRKDIYRLADAVFSANDKDRVYFIGKSEKDSPAEILKQYGGLKPCIFGSDAHTEKDLFATQSGNYCWIKGELSFNGLRQIIHEPEHRVRKSIENPAQKNPDQVIRRVRFKSADKNSNFSQEWIPLNPNLNTIIGGKSAGKSLLLRYMAEAANKKTFTSLTQEHQKAIPVYDFDSDPNFDFAIEWADGESSSVRGQAPLDRAITYIPQMYLNRLIEGEHKRPLDLLVEKLLRENNRDYAHFLASTEKKIGALQEKMAREAKKVFQTMQKLRAQEQLLSEFGEESAAKENVARLKRELKKLAKNAKLPAGGLTSYNSKLQKANTQKTAIARDSDLGRAVDTIITDLTTGQEEALNRIAEETFSAMSDDFPALRDADLKKLQGGTESAISEAVKSLRDSLRLKLQPLTATSKQLQAEKAKLRALEAELTPFEKAYKEQNELEKKTIQLNEEKERLKSIEETKKRIKNLRKKIDFTVLIDLFDQLKKEYDAIIIQNAKFREVPSAKKLEIHSRAVFDDRRYNASFLDKLDRRKRKDNTGLQNAESLESNAIPDSNALQTIAESLIDGSLRLRSEFTLEDALIALFSDYFRIEYDLLQDGDSLQKMSPGKMGIVLFQLFIHLSTAKYPILIDQPEDNLDNRTVYRELNDFIQEKKSERQIIIVTHNANLVVSTDAENVIVANQSGEDMASRNAQYKFEYMNGPIENSFEDPKAGGLLQKKGIREHICEILEGGDEAFQKRERKYSFQRR